MIVDDSAARRLWPGLTSPVGRMIKLGSRESKRSMGAAYAAASEHVVGQSDVLITLWTGAEPKGPGGTGLTVDAALAAHMPVVWINANDPRRVQIHSAEQLPARAVGTAEVRVGQARGYSVAVAQHGDVGYAVATDMDESCAQYVAAVERE